MTASAAESNEPRPPFQRVSFKTEVIYRDALPVWNCQSPIGFSERLLTHVGLELMRTERSNAIINSKPADHGGELDRPLLYVDCHIVPCCTNVGDVTSSDLRTSVRRCDLRTVSQD
jgi:hypothetical protein